jgi:hypothetical protein
MRDHSQALLPGTRRPSPTGGDSRFESPRLPGVGQAVADRLHHDPEKHEHGDDDEDVHGQSTLQSAEH